MSIIGTSYLVIYGHLYTNWETKGVLFKDIARRVEGGGAELVNTPTFMQFNNTLTSKPARYM